MYLGKHAIRFTPIKHNYYHDDASCKQGPAYPLFKLNAFDTARPQVFKIVRIGVDPLFRFVFHFRNAHFTCFVQSIPISIKIASRQWGRSKLLCSQSCITRERKYTLFE